MTKHATQFRKALANIEPGEDAENAAAAHREVSDVLRSDERLKKLGVSPVLIGSYARDVSIRRIKDVDVFVRLTEASETLRPGDILDHIADLLESAFPGHTTRQHRSIMVDFSDFDLSVDVVIARPCVRHPDEHWQIPQRIEDDGSARWIETNPTLMTELKTALNSEYLLGNDESSQGAYVPLVKLIRQIRRTWVAEQPGGYYFEVLTYHAFDDLQPHENTVAEYLVRVLEHLADHLPLLTEVGPIDPTLPDLAIKTKASPDQIEAAGHQIRAAAALARRALEETDQCESALMWMQLLGKTKQTQYEEQVFPLPEYCNADGSHRDSASVVRGSTAVPAGSDRYA